MINQIDRAYLFRFVFSKYSLFRFNQTQFLKSASKYIRGELIEIGAEPQFNHHLIFPGANYIDTNINDQASLYLDVTKIDKPDNSVDNYLCVSVLEHVPDIFSAVKEIKRTLRPGGYLILTIPFGYPIHDTVDYWRLAPDAYFYLFDGFEVVEFCQFGGRFSSCAEVLQRPRGQIKSMRHLVSKLVGWL